MIPLYIQNRHNCRGIKGGGDEGEEGCVYYLSKGEKERLTYSVH